MAFSLTEVSKIFNVYFRTSKNRIRNKLNFAINLLTFYVKDERVTVVKETAFYIFKINKDFLIIKAI